MRRSLANCSIVVSVRNKAGELAGIARVLTDWALTDWVLDALFSR